MFPLGSSVSHDFLVLNSTNSKNYLFSCHVPAGHPGACWSGLGWTGLGGMLLLKLWALCSKAGSGLLMWVYPGSWPKGSSSQGSSAGYGSGMNPTCKQPYSLCLHHINSPPTGQSKTVAKPEVHGWEVHSTSMEGTAESHDGGVNNWVPLLDTSQGGCPGRLRPGSLWWRWGCSRGSWPRGRGWKGRCSPFPWSHLSVLLSLCKYCSDRQVCCPHQYRPVEGVCLL